VIEVTLGLGSNTPFEGKTPVELLGCACARLEHVLSRLSFSSVYRTKALYVTAQEDFYNMAVRGFVSDDVTPHSLLEDIHRIEAEYGRDRNREIRFGPRPLDIDIELFGNAEVNDRDLVIPHPRMKERAFVLIPLLEILQESADVKERKSCEDALKRLPDQGVQLYVPAQEFVVSGEA
jgi:2-amino-4-hydroxy-6-hydroxymethyldihydropteridine diphosphokinase